MIVILAFLTNVMSLEYEYQYYDYPSDNKMQAKSDSKRSLRSYSEPTNARIRPISPEEEENQAMNQYFTDLLNGRISISEANERSMARVGDIEPGVQLRSLRTCTASTSSRCFRCLDSCNLLKKSRLAPNMAIQSFYLMFCSMGCRGEM